MTRGGQPGRESRADRGRGLDRGRRGDSGAATVLAVALAGLLLVVVAAGALVGELLTARARAAAAADLAALAAVPLSVRGPEPACRTAALIARDNSAVLVSCDVVGSDAVVRVSVRPRNALARWLLDQTSGRDTVEVGARAGAAGTPSSG